MQKLPPTEKFLRAKGHLTWGAERALLAHYTHSPNLCETHKIDCIKEIRAAANILGYELVEFKVRVDEKQFLAAVDRDGDLEVGVGGPFASGGVLNSNTNHLVGESANDRAEATPAARGGGRMDLPEDADA